MSDDDTIDADGFLVLAPGHELEAGSCLCYYAEDRCRLRECFNRKPGEPIESRVFDPGTDRSKR